MSLDFHEDFSIIYEYDYKFRFLFFRHYRETGLTTPLWKFVKYYYFLYVKSQWLIA